ncbi:hypothetical protein M7I_2093 [Glarea lozoyensis 74030]|uniref:Uncharacterized protein n=1 Tax=Glarea lozoyensis (strain ATCC 74030 / MF5533) TaxID=1104152 RepID=H0EHV4_GLAL7|nr:hypothetical protein M7I_2093 [Glarea lozoyensis 74030]
MRSLLEQFNFNPKEESGFRVRRLLDRIPEALEVAGSSNPEVGRDHMVFAIHPMKVRLEMKAFFNSGKHSIDNRTGPNLEWSSIVLWWRQFYCIVRHNSLPCFTVCKVGIVVDVYAALVESLKTLPAGP